MCGPEYPGPTAGGNGRRVGSIPTPRPDFVAQQAERSAETGEVPGSSPGVVTWRRDVRFVAVGRTRGWCTAHAPPVIASGLSKGDTLGWDRSGYVARRPSTTACAGPPGRASPASACAPGMGGACTPGRDGEASPTGLITPFFAGSNPAPVTGGPPARRTSEHQPNRTRASRHTDRLGQRRITAFGSADHLKPDSDVGSAWRTSLSGM